MTDAKPIPHIPDGWFDVPGRYVKEDRGYETPCWIWQLSVAGKPGAEYGQVNIHPNGRCGPQHNIRAHRVYYEREHGPITDPTLELHHRCDIKLCVNPAHLQPLTPSAHVRMSASHSSRSRRKLSPEAVRDIKTRRLANRGFAVLYGVSNGTIGAVVSGRTYTEVK